MKEADDRDDRIRRLFSRLPREKAPEDFEQRVARAVAGRRADSSGVRARVRAFAIPVFAVFLVGVLSILVYRDQSGPNAESGPPAAEPAAVEAAPPATGARPGGGNESPVPGPSARGVAAKGGTEPKGMTSDPGAPPADFTKRSKTAPIRTMMEERAVAAGTAVDSIPGGDSLARRDSLARLDSVARPDSVGRRDSVIRTSPGERPDSLHEKVPRSKRE